MTSTYAFCPACGTPATSSGAFCGGCGASLLKSDDTVPSQVDAAPSVEISSANSPPSPDTPSAQAPRKAIRRPFLVLAILVVALFAVGSISAIWGAISKGGGVDTSSISYKDGYAVGQNHAEGVWSTNQYNSFCKQDSTMYFSPGDNKSDWIAGCVAAMQQQGYNAQHPGANSGSTGNTGNT